MLFTMKDELHKRLFDIPVSSEWLFDEESKRIALGGCRQHRGT